jgi:hypothetical protein
MEEGGFVLTEIAWTGGNRFWPNWLGMEKVSFSLTGTAWNEETGFGLSRMAWKGGGCQFWPDWNSLEWRKFVLT